MPLRDIIQIDEELCDGCGDCVLACAEGAIKVIDGKARLISDSFCDGFGACLGECPQGAISIIQRDAVGYDEKAVQKHLTEQTEEHRPAVKPLHVTHSCPGSALQDLSGNVPPQAVPDQPQLPSQLGHWPVQLMLIPPHAPFLRDADLLICADCVPFAVPDFHQRYLTNRAVLVGCPKLDDLPHYREKIAAIFAQARPRRVTTLIMEVPCCHGLAQAVFQARASIIPETPLEVHTIGIRGGITEELVPGGGKQNSSAFNLLG